MKSEEAKEGLAKVVRRFKTIADVFIGDVRVHAVHSGDYATSDSEVCMEVARKMADDINRALSLLVRRAELAERMARVLYEASGRCFCTKRQIEKGHRPECATPDIERVLTAWDAIKGEGE